MAQASAAATDNELQAADLSSNEPELIYAEKSDFAYRKKLGQFFTPFSVASFMSKWLTELAVDEPRILDPCAGLGVFERAISAMNPEFATNARFTLWEKDERLTLDLAGICNRIAVRYSVIGRDFLDEHAWSETYDGIIANPPYYKHHFVENKENIRSVISSEVGAHFSVQTNVYCWFLIKALALLKPGGRLAFIVPSEFLNANYGRDVKKYLIERSRLRHIISVSYKSRIFEDAVTTACILLAERAVKPYHGIRFHRAESIDQLGDLTEFLAGTGAIEYRSSDLDVERKWRSYFPGNARVDMKTSQLVPFSTYGRFSRGIATGANEFFALGASSAEKLGLPDESLIPCICKARHAPGKIFTRADFENLRLAGRPVYLFDGEAATGQAIDQYIASGERTGYQHRYLTKSRNPWYAIEKRVPGRIWVCVFGRAGIRFVWNECNCVSLTCFHVFKPSDIGKDFLPFVFLYLNSSIGQRFLEREKREYGNGLEKYEPNDINNSLAPDFEMLSPETAERLAFLQNAFVGAETGSPEENAILATADAIFDSLI
ncbi:MAG: class I SAM-dependent DNA methyltransferase [Woeseia sp.]